MSVKTPPALARALIRPVSLRALIAALFSVPTIFLHELGPEYLRFGGAAFFVLTATQIWEHAKISSSHDKTAEKFMAGQSLTAAALLLGGAVMVFATSTFMAALVTGITLVVAGLAELAAWGQNRKTLPQARDLLISGAVQAVTGVALLIAVQADVHTLLGIFAGGGTIIAIFWVIAALGFRHDSRKPGQSEAERPTPTVT